MPNSFAALGTALGVICCFAWVSGKLSATFSGEGFLRRVGVETIVSVLAGAILHYLGLVDEWKLLSVPIFGGLSVALIASAKST